ncbi:MAG: 2-octaprenyl-6-methoxyphenyl hydroxylase [Endozoicomonas sp. (ex Botrylloides leachii)]|nr:2-octaprenyl-6-methoxyphenyl hydroxylase [Endozoicomonas sp. (ex Botrylloides leachii)]
MSQQYDVLIIGGGLVGATLACALEPLACLQGLKIAIVEPRPVDQPQSRPPSFDARSSALSYGTIQAYEKLGLWSSLAGHAESIKQVHVSDRGHFGMTRLSHKKEGVPALGYVIDNFKLGEVLLDRLRCYRKKQTLTLYSPAEVTQLNPTAGSMLVTLLDSTKKQHDIKASLVVLADGGRSGLMAQIGIIRDTHDYGQHALIANITTDKPHEGVAYERFSRNGPMALLPKKSLIDKPEASLYGLVWTLSEDEINDVISMKASAVIKKLQDSFGYRAGRFLQIGHRDSYPLIMGIAREQIRPNLVVLGNAAHTVHPVAGQGYNLAIRDVMSLANTIKAAVIDRASVGDLHRLMTYLQKQEADQKRVVAFCDNLINAFSKNKLPTVMARNMCLLGLDFSSQLKSHFTKAAMGL